MMSIVSKFIKDSSIYSLQPILQKAISFFLIPLYTAFLTPGDYGNLSYIITIGAFFTMICEFGMTSSFWKFRAESHDVETKKILFFNLYLVRLILGVSIILLAVIFQKVFKNLIDEKGLIYLIALVISIFYQNSLLIYRAEFKAKKYLIYSIINSVLFLLFNILFVVYFKMNYGGVIWGYFGSFVISSIISFHAVKEVKFKIDIKLLKSMLKYGYPLMIGNLAAVIISLSDRIFLKNYSNDYELGLYSYGYKYADLLNALLIQSFFLAWNPMRWEIYKRPDAKQVFTKFYKYILILFPIITLMLSSIIISIGSFITIDKTFLDGFSIVVMISISFIFFAFYYFNAMGILFQDKTYYITIIIALSSGVCLLFNFLLIPKYGLMGAGISTIISYYSMYLLARYWGQKFYPIKVNRSHEIIQILMLIIICIISTVIYSYISNILIYSVIIFLFGVCYMIVNLVIGALNIKEIASVYLLLKTKLSEQLQKKYKI